MVNRKKISWVCWRSIRVTLSCIIVFCIVTYFRLPFGSWALITVLLVSQFDFGSSVERAVHRFSGTVLGSLTGVIIGTYGANIHEIYILTLPLWFFLTWYLSIMTYAVSMFFVMLFLTGILFFLTNVTGMSVDQMLYYRILDISIGVSVAIIVEALFSKARNHNTFANDCSIQEKQLRALILSVTKVFEKSPIKHDQIVFDLHMIVQLRVETRKKIALTRFEPNIFKYRTQKLKVFFEKQRQTLDILSSLLILLEIKKKGSEYNLKVKQKLENISNMEIDQLNIELKMILQEYIK
ncbi:MULTISPECIES: FUSC family protein [unclassified Francisella]|uniref:FUSC family protein n=1 Tax=unclassified Francisella TaxID=2610885 RepID=UPI002E2F5C17|nr:MULTISPECIES: FUSC family protein [unclassified Francisella]MED7820148.1 FUSC family protein [Francisella sp. 19S2-4]MED7830979.1 FUSC family protein [Francisella sp. 19S2-10]